MTSKVLRTRGTKVEDPVKIVKVSEKVIRKHKKQFIAQTFVAKDKDISTVKYYPKTQIERSQFVNIKTGRRLTPFQYRVYDYVAQIPAGQVTTYKVLSDALKSHPRAVGQALRVNPFAPLPVPCHRVISSDFSIGGFSGGFGDHQFTADKKAKLEAEGCVFERDYKYKHNKAGSLQFFSEFTN